MAEKLCPLMRAPQSPAPNGFGHAPTPPNDAPAPCIEHRCRWYIQLLGKNPQTGEAVPEWGCAVEFLPLLLIENAQQVRHFSGAVESARNQATNDASAVAASVVEMANAVTHAAAHARARELAENGLVITPAEPRHGLLGRLALAFKGGS